MNPIASIKCPFDDLDPAEPFMFWAAANLSFSAAKVHTAILSSTDPLLLVPTTADSLHRVQTCSPEAYEDNRALRVLRFEAENYRMPLRISGHGNTSSFHVNYEKPPNFVHSQPLLPLNHTSLPNFLIRSNPFSSASLASKELSIAFRNAYHAHSATHGIITLVKPPEGLFLPRPVLVDLAPRQSRPINVELSTDSSFQPRPEDNPKNSPQF
ncbi:unnamed protein product [Agarophyton chilense]